MEDRKKEDGGKESEERRAASGARVCRPAHPQDSDRVESGKAAAVAAAAGTLASLPFVLSESGAGEAAPLTYSCCLLLLQSRTELSDVGPCACLPCPMPCPLSALAARWPVCGFWGLRPALAILQAFHWEISLHATRFFVWA